MKYSLKTKISTPKLAETKAFYETVFGMKVVEEWDSRNDKGAILEFEDGKGEAFLEIYHAEIAHDLSGVSLQFKVNNLDAFFAALPDDVNSEGPKDRPWGARYLYLRDPSDVLVIVYEGCN